MSTDKWLSYYERGIALSRHSLGEFAGRFPKTATCLSISGGLSEDPQVERLIQSFATPSPGRCAVQYETGRRHALLDAQFSLGSDL